jgi:hypothetical protein
MSIIGILAENNASCYDASRINLSDHWKVLYHPNFVGRAGTIPLIITFIMGVPLNLYIIIAMIYKRLYTQPTYLLLLNLGLSDLVTCLVPLLFGIITGLMGEVDFGDNDYIRCQICKISAGYILVTFSHSYIVVVLSLERLTFFVSPLRYRNSVTARRTVIVIIIIWCISIGFTIPPLFGRGDLAFGMWCGMIFLAQPHIVHSRHYFGICAFSGAACMMLLVVSNVWIAHIAIRSMSKVRKIRIAPRHSIVTRNRREFLGSSHKKSESAGTTATYRCRMRRKISVHIVRRQFRFLQIFGCILLVNIFTRLPIFILIVMSLIDITAIRVEAIAFVQFAQLSQATIHPVLETLIAPELRHEIASHCTICCPNIQDTKIGKCFSKVLDMLSNFCRLNLWTNALEQEIEDFGDYTKEDLSYMNIVDTPILPSSSERSELESNMYAQENDGTNQHTIETELHSHTVTDISNFPTELHTIATDSSNLELHTLNITDNVMDRLHIVTTEQPMNPTITELHLS